MNTVVSFKTDPSNGFEINSSLREICREQDEANLLSRKQPIPYAYPQQRPIALGETCLRRWYSDKVAPDGRDHAGRNLVARKSLTISFEEVDQPIRHCQGTERLHSAAMLHFR